MDDFVCFADRKLNEMTNMAMKHRDLYVSLLSWATAMAETAQMARDEGNKLSPKDYAMMMMTAISEAEHLGLLKVK